MKNKIISMVLIMALITSSIMIPNSFVKASTIGNNDTQKDAGNCTDKKEYVVLAKDSESSEQLADKLSDDLIESEEKEALDDADMCTVELTKKEARQLKKDDDVLLVEENILFDAECNDEVCNEKFDEENEPIEMEEYPDPGLAEPKQSSEGLDFGALWSRDFVHANPLELDGVDGNGVRIAILDSGLIDGSEYESDERIDFVGNDLEDNLNLHYDLTGHGTGINTVIRTTCPDASVSTVRILDENNQATLSRVLAGVQWAIDNDVDVINMSFGTSLNSEILHRKLREAYDAGILLVGAAGNTGKTTGKVMYPAAYDEVISVGSSDSKGNISEFSPKCTEILAPGEGIITEGAGAFGRGISFHRQKSVRGALDRCL